MQRHRPPSAPVTTDRVSPASRTGVTLTEVLMSLLVMGVAVSSVMILFPLSLLRSVQGRQLTQATILRYNAENQLDLHPNMFSHIDVNGAFQNIQSGENLFIDPLGWHYMWEIDLANTPQTDYRNYINDQNPGLRRFNSGLRDPMNPNNVTANQPFLNQARKRVSLPDTWIEITRGIPGSYDFNNAPLDLPLPDEFDLSSIPFDPNNTSFPDPPGIARVTVFDATARFSDVRTIDEFIDSSGNKSLTLSSALSPRVRNNVGGARIQIQEQRFTWLLTVRSSVRSADVVVFFRRSFSAEDEQFYPAGFSLINPGPDGQPGVKNVDDDNQNGTDDFGELGWNGSDDLYDKFNRTILVKWTTAEPPTLKRGAYIFDVRNALWYRIHDILNPGDYLNTNTATLVLDDVVKKPGAGGAMLMRGIVDVYSISF